MLNYDTFMNFLKAVDDVLDKLYPKFSYNSFLEFLSDYFDETIINK